MPATLRIPTVKIEAAIQQWKANLLVHHGIYNLNQIGNGHINSLVSDISKLIAEANEDVE